MAIFDTRAWIEVDLDALRANYDTVRRRAGGAVKVIPMVKADAYGVGLARVVRVLEPAEPWGYGVATAAEGAALRAYGVRGPVLVVAPMPAGDVDIAARSRLTACLSSIDGLEAWRGAAERVGETLDFHVDVDTGMGRTGFDWAKVGEWGPAVHQRSGEDDIVRWTGAFTHFHSADDPDGASAERQRERFRDALVQLPVPREQLLVHAANSAAALRWPGAVFDAVRPGIFLYGGRPAPAVDAVPEPATVLTVRARVGHTKAAAAGSTVGYGATHVAEEAEEWATLCIGYGDGLPRLLGNRGAALLGGRRVPILGRISMDLTTVALEAPVAIGDVATLIGEDGDERITVDEVAEQAATIGYEILVGLGASRLPRYEVTTERDEERR